MKNKNTYTKFQEAEDAETAYAMVLSGQWTVERFAEWLDQVKHIEYMYATADESF